METQKFYTYLKDVAETELALRARAAMVHKNVNQTYGQGHEYSYHLNTVAYFTVQHLCEIVEKVEDIIPVIFGAYFHDSIEDARLTYNDVMKIAREYMNDEQAFMAAEIVYALTNEKGRNRAERANDKYYEGIRNTPYAPLVKAADRMANYEYAKSLEGKESMRKAYEKEMEHFITSITSDSDDIRVTIPNSMIKELKG